MLQRAAVAACAVAAEGKPMKENIVIIGASGHARSVMDIILQNEEYYIAGCLSKDRAKGELVEGMSDIEIIGGDDRLEELYVKGVRKAFVAIGDNKIRKKIMQKAGKIGFEFPAVISRHAVLSPSAVVSGGTCVMPGAILNVNVHVGQGCIINTNCSVDHDCIVEDYVHIAPGTAVSGTTVIGEGVFIGTNSAVIDGIHIGEWSRIGAGAAVVKDIPAKALACGVPAIVKKER